MRNLKPGDVVRVNRGGLRGPADEQIETVEWVSDNGSRIRTENGTAETALVQIVRSK